MTFAPFPRGSFPCRTRLNEHVENPAVLAQIEVEYEAMSESERAEWKAHK